MDARIDDLSVSVYTIPTDGPESDGTLEWSSTTMVLVEISAGDTTGMGHTYASSASARFIEDLLRGEVVGKDAMAIPTIWEAMVTRIRNQGRPGITSMSIAAVDCALWDLKARLLGLPLVTLLGAARTFVPIYGSGGFTSYDDDRLARQLGGWVEQGIPRVKMKVGRDAQRDVERVALARRTIGDQVSLFVDANGGYEGIGQAAAMGLLFAERFGVTWYEEPVSSEHLAWLRRVREQTPAALEIAAGEYGFDATYFKRMLDAEAVDCLQADVTRCSGITGFLQVAALCDAADVPLSAHCAPAQHVHVGCAAPRMRHLEYFHDHVRIEHMLFDNVSEPIDGALWPDLTAPGTGLTLKRADAQRFAA